MATAVFFPLLMGISWINYTYSTGLESSAIFTYAVGLSLAYGFGTGGAKFMSLFKWANRYV